MKICLDIQSAISQRAGVGRYTYMLARQLSLLPHNDNLTLFYFDFKRQAIPIPLKNAQLKAHRFLPGRIVQQSWKKLNAPPYDWFAGTADVYHFPNFIRPPLNKGKSVVTVHDISFIHFPEAAEQKNLRYLNAKIKSTVQKADAIITDSKFVAQELQEHLQVPENKIHPIHLGLSDEWTTPSPEAIQTTLQKYRLERPYLLHVGTLEPRKNHTFLIDVFEQMTEFDGDLVFVGMEGWKTQPLLQRLKNSPQKARIKWLKYIEDDELNALYAGAKAFLFPSLYEGFGFPPLEAMRIGTPVICANTGSLPEVVGNAGMVLSLDDPEVWAHQTQTLLSDTDLQENMIRSGRKQAANFTWKACAQQTLTLYHKLAP